MSQKRQGATWGTSGSLKATFNGGLKAAANARFTDPRRFKRTAPREDTTPVSIFHLTPGSGRPDGQPPIQVPFIGTIHPDADDAAPTPERLVARVQEEAANLALFTDAITLLSQSPTGADLLKRMAAEGYSVVFDDKRTGDHGAGGLCDPSEKMIVLKSGEDPAYLALLIGHEAVHALQNRHDGLFPSSSHRPETGIRLSFAIEADAYAQQTIIALELARGTGDGPRHSEPLRQMRLRFPELVQAAEKAARKPDALETGAATYAVFEAFYDNYYLRSFYEASHVEWVENFAKEAEGGSNDHHLRRSFNRKVEGEWIKSRIMQNGKAYLKTHGKDINLDDPRYCGVTQKTADDVQKFYDTHLPRHKTPKLPIYGLFIPASVNDNDPAPADAKNKKKIKAPKKRKRDFW